MYFSWENKISGGNNMLKRKLSTIILAATITNMVSTPINVLADTLNNSRVEANQHEEITNGGQAIVRKFTLQNSEYLDSYNESFKMSNSNIKSITNNGRAYNSSTLDKAIDENFQTHWETGIENSSSFTNEVIITLEEAMALDRIVYAARPDAGGKGFAQEFEIYSSMTEDGEDFELVSTGGYTGSTKDTVEIKFKETEFKRVKFVFKKAANNWASAAEFMFYKEDALSDKMSRLFTDETLSVVSEEFNSIEKINVLEEEVKNHPLYENFKENIENAKLIIKGNVVNYTDAKVSNFKEFNSDDLVKYNELFKLSKDKVTSITTNGGHYGSSNIEKAIDGDVSTSWHSGKQNSDDHTNEVVITLDKITTLDRVVYTAARGTNRGFAEAFDIYASKTSKGDTFKLVSSGTSNKTQNSIEIKFNPTEFKRIKFVFKKGYENWALAAEFGLYTVDELRDKVARLFTDNTMNTVSEEFNTLEKINELEEEAKLHPFYNDFKEDIENARELIKMRDVNYTDAKVSKFIDIHSELLPAYDEVYKVSSDKITSITTNGGHYGSSNIEKAMDGNFETSWHSGRQNTSDFTNEVVITLDEVTTLNRIVYTAARGTNRGFAEAFDVYASTTSKGDTFKLVSSGRSSITQNSIEIKFNPTDFKRVKFVFKKGYENWALAAEFGLYTQDKTSEKVEKLFTNGLMTEVSEEFNTIEKINALEIEINEHPLKDNLLENIELAKEIVNNPNLFENSKIVTAEQRGRYREEMELRSINGAAYASFESVGKYVTAGEEIVVYVDADANGVLPQLCFGQVGKGKGDWRRWANLQPGKNIITVPSGINPSAIYVVNHANPEDQAYAPRVRVEGGTEFPIYIHGETNPNEFYNELKEYASKVEYSDEAFAEGNPEGKFFNIAELVSENCVITTSAMGALAGLNEVKDKDLTVYNTMEEWEEMYEMFQTFQGLSKDAEKEEDSYFPNKFVARVFSNVPLGFADHGYTGYLGSNNEERDGGFYKLIAMPITYRANDNWCYNHEFGHIFNTQYIVDGEVTNNLYAQEYRRIKGLGGDRANWDEIMKRFKGEEFAMHYFERLAVLSQINIAYGYDAYAKASQAVRDNKELFKSISGNDIQRLAVAYSLGLGVDLLDFFKGWNYCNIEITEQMRDAVSHLPKLDKKIEYLHSGAYDYTGNGFTEDIVVNVNTNVNEEENTVTLSFGVDKNNQDDVLGYEILKDGEVIGYTKTSSFTMNDVNLKDKSKYEVVVYAKDLSTAESVEVKVFKPTLSVEENVTLALGSEFDANAYMSAFNYKGEIIENVTVNSNVDTSQKGNYEVTYSVTDNDITIEKKMKVNVASKITYASDIEEVSAKVAWGVFGKDKAPNSTPIELDRQGVVVKYAKGLGTHADSEVIYNVEEYDRFEAYVGIDQSMRNNGSSSATFIVYVDGEKVYDSGKYTSNRDHEFISIDLRGASELKLVTDDLGNNSADQTVWADAKFINDNTKPTIEIKDETIKLGEELDLLEGVTAFDIEDGNLIDNIKVDAGNFTINKTGKYTITYTVEDSDGNVTTKERVIVVYSGESYASDNNYTINASGWGGIRKDKSPNNDIISVLVNGEEKEFTKGIGAHANSELVFDIGGKGYEYFYSVLGLDDNVRTNANGSVVYKILVDDELVYESNVFRQTTESEEVLISLAGASKVTLITNQGPDNDWADQSVWADAKFLVTNSKPTIEVTNKTIKLGEELDVMEGITATDAEDGVLTEGVEIVSNNFEQGKLGRFEIVYKVTDSDDNVAEKKAYVTVYEEFDVTKSKYVEFDNLEAYNEMFKIPVSSISNNGGNYSGSPIDKAIDGNINSHWETGRPNNSSFKNEVVFDLGEVTEIDKIAYAARRGGKGFATRFEIYVSSEAEGNDFILAGTGSYNGSRNDVIEIDITKTEARRVKFKFVEAYDSWASIGEMSFYRTDELADKIANELFTDESKTVVTESYNTLEKLEVLRNEVSNHPAASLFQEDLNKAEEVIRASFPVLNIPKAESTKLGMAIDLEGGYTATDKEDGDITSSVEVSGDVNFNKAGEYTLTYRVTDANGNETVAERTIAVVDMNDYYYLTEYDWKSTNNSYTAPRKDVSISGKVLRLTGEDGQEVSYERGIGAHSTSTIVYDLTDKNYDYFTSYVGVDRQMYNTSGSVSFEVYVDGEKKFDSGLMNSKDVQKFVEVDINGAKELKLVVTDGGNGDGSDHATWGDAKLHYANNQSSEINRSELDSLIKRVNELDSNLYSEESFTNLKTVLEEVNNSLTDGYNQEEVDTVYNKLNEAYEALVKLADLTALEEALVKANAIDKDIYTEETIMVLEEVILKATELLNNKLVSQEEVNLVVEELNNTINALEIKIDLSEVVNIKDKYLKQAIKKALSLDSDDVTIGDMYKLDELDASYGGITSLEGLQYAKNLQSLNVEYNEINDLSPLKDLKRLTNLQAKYQNIAVSSLYKKDNKITVKFDAINKKGKKLNPIAVIVRNNKTLEDTTLNINECLDENGVVSFDTTNFEAFVHSLYLVYEDKEDNYLAQAIYMFDNR